MSCSKLPQIVQGSRGVYIAFRVTERNAAGQLVAVDLAPAASAPGYARAFFRPPSSRDAYSLLLRPAVVQAPTTSGVATYQTEAGFLDEVGTWEAMLEVCLPGSGQGAGLFHSFPVAFEVVRAIRPFSGSTLLEPTTPELGLLAASVNVAA